MQSAFQPVAALRVNDLKKDYGKNQAVKGVTFSVKPGEVFGLLGPNGAGKTSIISIIVTLEPATSGCVEIFGVDVAQQSRLAKTKVGWVPQEIINHGYFTVEEILKFISGFHGRRKNKDRIDYLLHRLSLWNHRNKKVKELSGGMKRRLMIGKALVHEPKLLLLDEPTAGVDLELRLSLWKFVEDLKKEGVSILLTTHYLEEAENICDRVAVLHHGELKKIGPTQELVQSLTSRMIRLHFKREIRPLKHPYLTLQNQMMAEFSLPSATGIGELLNDLQLDLRMLNDIQIIEGNLEDAFRFILEQQK
ncbi:MAG: ABC transporter ATP-binding protein [Bdellovibrionales bacterium]|nr:ABC transporter ATP-binding protein [Bdellovibrionales bacterium]